MQRAAATRTGVVVVDVDHHLDAAAGARGKRSTIHPTLGGSIGPLRRIGRVNLGIAARLDLLDLFKAEQQLIFRQRLGPAAEAMALQFLDDPDGSRSFCVRSAISIAFSVPGSSGSESVTTVMTGLDHAAHRVSRAFPGALI